MKINDLVVYIHQDTQEDIDTGFYPPIGTIGRVISTDNLGLQVEWPEGTTTGGGGFIDNGDVKLLPSARGWVLTGTFEDIAKCPYCAQHEHPITQAVLWDFCPYCGHRINYNKEGGDN